MIEAIITTRKKSALGYSDVLCRNKPWCQYSPYKKGYKRLIESAGEYRVEKRAIREEKLSIELANKVIAELPLKLGELYKEIEKSKYILQYENNWDDEGSIGYAAKTWERGVQFITDYAKWTLDNMSIAIPTPKIYPGPHGSIDILWKGSNYKLLVNIPKDTNKDASFYGDCEWEKIKGTFNPSKIKPGILLNLLKTN